MSTDYDSFTNRGEYFSAHYFAEQLGADLKKGLFATWALRESDKNYPHKTPREQLRTLRIPYLTEKLRSYFAEAGEADAEDETRAATYNNPEWSKRLAEWHQTVLQALGYDTTPTELIVHRAGRDHTLTVAYHGHGIIALDCGWSADNDAALDADGAGRLLSPLHVSTSESYTSGQALTSWLFQSELGEEGGPHPRFILLLCGGVILLADRHAWNEGRYLAVNLDGALERNDRSQLGELSTIAALFSLDMLRPGENDQSRGIDALLKASGDNAVGVSGELRYGLQRSVEIIANDVLRRMAEPGNNVTPADLESPKIPFARELTREALRYLYRILFLLYAEARPELGILPADDGSYEAGYSMARLRELVAREEELVEEEAKTGFHLYASLDVLFNKVNFGHRPYGTEPDDDQPGDDEETRQAKAARRSEDRGLRFEPLRSELFEPTAIRLIGTGMLDPRSDEDDEPRWLDLRLRNEALHEVLRLLTMKKGKRGERGGFISYRNLGINQLGAVYEGLMSYTGIIANEELCEVARGGDPDQGSWLIPLHKQDQYPDKTLVHYNEADARKGLRGPKKYDKGSFVYRLAGRARETSASYYTPESLTKVTVELTLKNRLDQERDENGEVIETRASELLKYKICEPALGSGAFLNEAINQVADEYLRRRQKELGITIPTADAITEKQRVKAYIALHNAYGVDLNATGVELAEVSLWLNTMHPGMQAPWFGLHLRRGNSLIGARRAVYAGDDVADKEKTWLKAKSGLSPTPLPFSQDGEPPSLPDDAVHQFLLPNPGWAAVAGWAEAKELAKEGVERLAAWKKGILQRPQRSTAHLNKDGSPKRDPKTKQPKQEATSQFTRLRDAALRVEFLWSAVVKRMELSEKEIARRIKIWQATPEDPEYAFLQNPDQAVPKEKVLEDLFNAVDTPYWRLKTVMDAWCALWFWPTDKAGLLDGTDGEYAARMVVEDADDLREVLGEKRVIQDTPQPSAAPVPKSEPRFVEAVALFAIGPEQATIWDIEPSADDDVVVELQKVGSTGTKKAAKPRTPERRKKVPLKDLDDWLEFLEAMLGRADVPPGTLLDTFKSLDELKTFEETIPHFLGMDFGDPEDRFPWLGTVRNIAEEQGFLHWELEFALIFARDGGFDLQVGNPPWVRPEWKDNSVLAEYEPWFMLTEKPSATEKKRRRNDELGKPHVAAYLLAEMTVTATIADYLSASQVYPLISGSQPDLYRAFMCQAWDHTAPHGSVGLIHPDTHFNGDKNTALREAAYRRLRVHADFVNAGNRFFPPPVGRSSHFGVHIYGDFGEISFDHLSWLFSVDSLRLSAVHDGSGDAPGVKFQGGWNERPHKQRVIHVTPYTLARWQQLSGEKDVPAEQARLLTPVSRAEDPAIDALAAYPLRLGALDPQITAGFHEGDAKKAKFGPGKDTPLIEYNKNQEGREDYRADSWDEVILKGPQFGVANPLFKQPSQGGGEVRGLDHKKIASDAIPESEYRRAADENTYYASQERWVDHRVVARLRASDDGIADARRQIAQDAQISEEQVTQAMIDTVLERQALRRYVAFHRLVWRQMIAPDTERAFYVAVIPPGAAHIHGVRSGWASDDRSTVLLAGFWAALPIDYLLRVSGTTNLDVTQARRLPAPAANHPLASSLLLRILRLNCLTTAYAGLWGELYDPEWVAHEPWARVWKGMKTQLHAVTPNWQHSTPLRSERARRAALIEIDALVAVWLGIDADTLITMYRARFPIMQDFDLVTWFDAHERKIAGDRYTYGHGQTKDHWNQFEAYLNDPDHTAVPDGYTAPFHKADRETEMREAHVVFKKRLDNAIARGEWDPVKQEVPKP
ncbi:class I SAM-dependent DNA methyltransferase [Nonomuraea mangrovi]|uniref:site-specific DNA-methyltransferase (adenine-specific) n=1 Tax=Nonomuraea mangrovi TaxID=2316207 RepID=A0ABW4TDE3_9ACTN